MTIEPLKGFVYLKTERASAGVLDVVDNRAVEFAEVLAVGDGITNLKPGDRVFVKAWSCDLVDYKDERYVFVHIDTNGILAKANEES